MRYILYFIYFFLTFLLAIICLPSPYDTWLEIASFCLIFWSIPVLFRLSKYLVLMLKTRDVMKKSGFKTTKFQYFPFPSKFRGRYSMSLKKDEKIINIVFLSKKLQYKNYYFESIDTIRFSSYNRVMLYHGNGAGRHGSHVQRTNIVNKKDLGMQKIVWPTDDQQKEILNIILFDKWPDFVTDSTNKDNKPLEQGDYICKSNIQAFDEKSFSEFLKTI